MTASETRSSRRKWVLTGLAVVAVLLAPRVRSGVIRRVRRGRHRDRRVPPRRSGEHAGRLRPCRSDVDPGDGREVRHAGTTGVTLRRRATPQIPDAKLAGWWIPQEQADAPAVVVVHGVQSCRREASVLLAAGMLHRAGFSVFADGPPRPRRLRGRRLPVRRRQRGVPRRPRWLGLGPVAGRAGRQDRRRWACRSGSISSVIAGGQEPQVPAVWADSAATRMDEAIGNFLADQLKDSTGLSQGPRARARLLWARIIAGRRPHEVRPHRRRSTPTPVATSPSCTAPRTRCCRRPGPTELHDRAVAAGAITPDAWIVPEAGHNKGVYVDPDGYEQRLVEFFSGGPRQAVGHGRA